MAPPSWGKIFAPAKPLSQPTRSILLLQHRTQPQAVALVFPTDSSSHQIFHLDTVPFIY